MKSKTKSKNEPWAPAQPFILQGLENSGRVFNETQPQLEQYAGMQRDTYGRLAPGAEAGILATQGAANRFASGEMNGQNPGAAYWQKAMSGGFRGQSPTTGYLTGLMGGSANDAFGEVLDNTLDDVENRVNSRFAARNVGFGRSSTHAGALGRELGRTSAAMRSDNFERDQAQRLAAAGLLDSQYGRDLELEGRGAAMADQAYNADLARQMGAWGTTQDLMRGSQGLLSEAANLPWLGVGALSGNVRQNSAGYGTTTQTQNSGVGGLLGAGIAAAGAAGQLGWNPFGPKGG